MNLNKCFYIYNVIFKIFHVYYLCGYYFDKCIFLSKC